ncbi:MAG TPA: GAF domain-containing protein [Ktedonobacteraceae bacterium]
MIELQKATTWREMLGRLIAEPQEKARLAQAARVRPVTLHRWADGSNRPHLENMRLLLRNIAPEAVPLFQRLLLIDFPLLREEGWLEQEIAATVPGEFYARVLNNLSLTPQPLCRQAMLDLVLQQIVAQLDPERYGLLVSLAICVPPREGKLVRSLCEQEGLGTPPWPRDLSERLFFLGSESLVGYAVEQMHSFVINSRDEMSTLPAHWRDHERSAAAFPLLRHARIAGCLLVASTQDFFFTPARLALLEDYSYLATCIFDAEEFFDSKQIDLQMMPRYALQLPYFAGYQRRVVQKLSEVSAQGQYIVLRKARELVVQELEEVLLRVFLQNEVVSTPEQ